MTKRTLFFDNMNEVKAGTVVKAGNDYGVILKSLSNSYRSIKFVETFKQACDVAYCLKVGVKLRPSFSAIDLFDYACDNSPYGSLSFYK